MKLMVRTMMRTKDVQTSKLKLNKDKCHFRCTSVPFFGEIISRHGVKPDLQKLKKLTEMPTPNTKRNSKHSLE